MTFKEKKKPKNRDINFNDYLRKIRREKLFSEMTHLLEKHPLPRQDLLFILNLIRHKIVEGYEKTKP